MEETEFLSVPIERMVSSLYKSHWALELSKVIGLENDRTLPCFYYRFHSRVFWWLQQQKSVGWKGRPSGRGVDF